MDHRTLKRAAYVRDMNDRPIFYNESCTVTTQVNDDGSMDITFTPDSWNVTQCVDGSSVDIAITPDDPVISAELWHGHEWQ